MTTQPTYRWGILGTGAIAQTFAGDLSRVPGAQLVAVGSRTGEAAEHFGERFGGGGAAARQQEEQQARKE